ncbi:MAG TPA: hypothetical protein VG942_05660, partial [Hyphomonadaceae bacterium]|nr:hypothetical protein [Hyphomonadaceae bacterium]
MADASSGKVPIVECVSASWRFLMANWQLFLPAAAITAPFGAVSNYLLATSGGTGSAIGEGIGELLAMVPVGLAGVAFSAAVLRKAIRDEFSGIQGLQFGADEFRLLGVAAGLTLLFVPFILIGSLALGAFVLNRLGSTPEDLQKALSDPDALYQALSNAL